MDTLMSKNIIMGSQLPKLKNKEKQNEKMKKQNKTKTKQNKTKNKNKNKKKRDSLQTCPSHKSYEVKAVGLSLFNYSTFKIKIL